MVFRDRTARPGGFLPAALVVIPLVMGLLAAGPSLGTERAVLGELFSADG